MSQYKIVRTTRAVPAARDLEPIVNEHCQRGWYPTGQPFHDEATGEWCQAMMHPAGDKPGQVALKEPRKR